MRSGIRRSRTTVRAYIEDTDAGGVVFYANYLKFMERARTESLREVGIDLVEWQVRHRRLFVVRSVRIDYLSSARLDDLLTVHADMSRPNRASIACHQPIFRGSEQLIDAHVELVCLDADRIRPVRVPGSLLAALDAAQPDDLDDALDPVPTAR